MTSSFKIGLISVCVVGVGLGAYLVNLGLKSDRNVKKSTDASVNTGGSASTSGTEGSNPGAPAGSGSGTLAMTDNNTGNAASPPPVLPSAAGGDSERSFRPHTPEATPAPQAPPTMAGDTSGAGGMGSFGTPATPSNSGSAAAAGSGTTGGSGTTTPPPPSATTYTPPAPTPSPAVASGERMGLSEPTTGGSSSGPGTTADKSATPTPAAPEKMTIHVVQPGETLSSIAAKYLGNARHASLIAKANPNIRPNRISVGAKLKIPTVQAPTTAPAGSGTTTVVAAKNGTQKAAVTPPPPVDPSRAYTVKANDSWTGLARKYLGHDNWTVLYEYNKERFPRTSRTLKPGMVIEIPPKDAAAPKAAVAPKDTTTPKTNTAPKK
jgi:LysM repeat protein